MDSDYGAMKQSFEITEEETRIFKQLNVDVIVSISYIYVVM